MKNSARAIFSLFLRIYASYVLGLSLLLLPITIWSNQILVFSISSPLFSSSILQQNVLSALDIVLFGRVGSTKFAQFEVQHLRDVHVLFVYFYILGLIALILLFAHFLKKRVPKKYLGFSMIGVGVSSVIAGIFFSTFFELFHRVLFPQGNFAFAYNSMLIQTFPPGFWLLQFLELQFMVILSLFLQFRRAE